MHRMVTILAHRQSRVATSTSASMNSHNWSPELQTQKMELRHRRVAILGMQQRELTILHHKMELRLRRVAILGMQQRELTILHHYKRRYQHSTSQPNN